MIINLEDNITPNFKWKEALLLRQWDRFIFPRAYETKNIIDIAEKGEKVRSLFGDKRIIVKSWLRLAPYNEFINGAEFSWHIEGGGLDFEVEDIPGHEVRKTLEPHLEAYGLRMEILDETINYTHIDNKPVPLGGNRYFYP